LYHCITSTDCLFRLSVLSSMRHELRWWIASLVYHLTSKSRNWWNWVN